MFAVRATTAVCPRVARGVKPRHVVDARSPFVTDPMSVDSDAQGDELHGDESAERERERLDAGIKEFDQKRSIDDRCRLSNQLV